MLVVIYCFQLDLVTSYGPGLGNRRRQSAVGGVGMARERGLWLETKRDCSPALTTRHRATSARASPGSDDTGHFLSPGWWMVWLRRGCQCKLPGCATRTGSLGPGPARSSSLLWKLAPCRSNANWTGISRIGSPVLHSGFFWLMGEMSFVFLLSQFLCCFFECTLSTGLLW